MTLPVEVRLLVRERAQYACEYCTVTETDSGGELTIDHYHPPSKGGSFDDLSNLLYCCQRCNNYKSDYWPRRPANIPLWNPRNEHREQHMVVLENGTVYPTTPIGTFTIQRLRLNRPPLVAYRLRRIQTTTETRLLAELRELLLLQERLQNQHARLIQEQRDLLEQQRELLTILVKLLK